MMQHCRLLIVCAGGAFFSFKYVDLFQWGNAIDGSITSCMELIPIGGETRHETAQMHPQIKAPIHGWAKYQWMINFHEMGCNIVTSGLLNVELSSLYST